MEWDALGVSGAFGVPDEYDCMISPLLRHLLDGTNTRSLAGWISHERSSHFGLGPDDARDRQGLAT